MSPKPRATNYNYQLNPAAYNQLTQQPAVRLDYQFTPNIRMSAKYSGQIQRPVVQVGSLPGFNDAYVPYPTITNYGATFDWSITPTTVVEVTYGSIKNQLAGGNNGGLDTSPASNRLKSLPGFPELYPQAGVVSSSYYDYQVLQKEKPVFWDGTSVNLPPIFGWGGLIGAAPPNLQFPGWLNVNHTQDVAGSLTKIVGRHTLKAGAYFNHSYKAQNTGRGRHREPELPRVREFRQQHDEYARQRLRLLRTRRSESSRSTCRRRNSSKATWSTTRSKPLSRITGR